MMSRTLPPCVTSYIRFSLLQLATTGQTFAFPYPKHRRQYSMATYFDKHPDEVTLTGTADWEAYAARDRQIARRRFYRRLAHFLGLSLLLGGLWAFTRLRAPLSLEGILDHGGPPATTGTTAPNRRTRSSGISTRRRISRLMFRSIRLRIIGMSMPRA
ncbi:hypothetical protein EJ06DRAFT_422551 [Trichodelitschia bisporula]|uniref:Uncharacterized protein n=1 Tax=Trichodelitschia bisporula TaxID=703511 RepID=A0A6G1HWD1_9PEZI|nr:hypothetical protein EJ06DRAFT_422551 [Trichodelitschia bisporula]